MKKNYVLDANILLHDPASVLNFADNTVIIPVGILEEIDRFKKEMTDRGFNARAVARRLDALRGQHSLARGVELPQGGVLRVHCDPERSTSCSPLNGDLELLRVAKEVHTAEPDRPVIIVTKDINLRIRADAIGLQAADYETDHVHLSDIVPGASRIPVSAAAMEQFRANGSITAPGEAVTPNRYVMLEDESNPRRTVLARANPDGQALLALHTADQGICGIKPRNREQHYAVDALLDEDIQMVTLMGKAGTGKTLLAVAAAMHMALQRKRYRGMLVARPIVPLGRDIGFLPGQIESKLEPWMKPIADTIDYLLGSGGPIRGFSESEALLASGHIEIQPLTYIRGRSIANRYVVIDEAQNLTPLEVKTVITRIGQDAKVILTGDPFQIDNPYVDANSNGFTHLMNRMKGQDCVAHITLEKGERSALAELAANLL